MSFYSTAKSSRRAFSIVELLVAMTVLLLMLAIIFKITQGTADVWQNSTGKTEGFREARGAFDAMTRDISQATLNTYFDYTDASGAFKTPGDAAFIPNKYMRRSDLHFVSGKSLLGGAAPGVANPLTHAVFFQAPLGYTNNPLYNNMESLLNGCGFYVSYGADKAKPGFLGTTPDRYRFRLMQFTQPSEQLMIYDSSVIGTPASPNWDNNNWFVNPLKTAGASQVSQLAENVVALVILPKYSNKDSSATSLAPVYEYDSRNRANAETLHQLPPVVLIVMVIIDETSAARLGNTAIPPNLGLSGLFQQASKLEDDLATLESNLSALPGNAAGNHIPLRYEVFRSEVALRGAKWSSTP